MTGYFFSNGYRETFLANPKNKFSLHLSRSNKLH